MLEKYTCPNGVRIVHEKLPHVRSAAIGIWVKAGSMHEDESEAGLAHFIEHMLFKGTAQRSARDIAEQFDLMGGDINAFTSKEMTCYFTTVLGHHAEKAVTVLADMFFNSSFDPEEIEKEKMVIYEEIASVEDTPEEDVDELLWSDMFAGHPIGRTVGGKEETIRTFSKEKIQKFLNAHYVPENIVISIAGNYDDGLLQTVIKLFGSYTSKQRTVVPAMTETPLFQSAARKKVKDIEQAHFCIGFPGLTIRDPQLHDLILLDSIIGGTMSSRLFQEIREERGLAYSVYSYYSAYESTGAFVVYGGTSPERLQEAMETVEDILCDIADNGISERELLNAKEQLKGSFLLGLESTEAIMHRNGKQELILEDHKSIDEVVSLIDEVTVEKVNAMACKLLKGQKAVSILGPQLILESR
ncbi:M16 family metallopeptidase [Sporosarcina cyprini]|uniref:M16 family metallopeptidase n=1 Tax=Sporosarcina cyprini TaxID=2910523 RepID=UPI001EE05BF1|nr:pitrilysin family protein [Sporosarcina cyprini]MCG3090053.1 insulinase family protein [Sporosarcina cyprini]